MTATVSRFAVVPDHPEVAPSPSASPVTGAGPAGPRPRHGLSLTDAVTGTTVGQRHPPVGQASGYTPGVSPDAVRNAGLQPGNVQARRTLEFLGAARAAAPVNAGTSAAPQAAPTTVMSGDEAAAHMASQRPAGFDNHRAR